MSEIWGERVKDVLYPVSWVKKIFHQKIIGKSWNTKKVRLQWLQWLQSKQYIDIYIDILPNFPVTALKTKAVTAVTKREGLL